MGDDKDLIDPENAELLMGYVLEHYIKHTEVVFKKLGHARAATHEGIKEIDGDDKASKKMEEMQAYDEMWAKIIAMFEKSGVSEEELVRIEEILGRIPRLIKKYYDTLVEQDAILQELMKELQSEEYQQAIETVNRVQSEADLMSGLDPNEFDLEEIKQAFVFQVPNLRDSIH